MDAGVINHGAEDPVVGIRNRRIKEGGLPARTAGLIEAAGLLGIGPAGDGLQIAGGQLLGQLVFPGDGIEASLTVHQPDQAAVDIDGIGDLAETGQIDGTVDKTDGFAGLAADGIADEEDGVVIRFGDDGPADYIFPVRRDGLLEIRARRNVDRKIVVDPAAPVQAADRKGLLGIAVRLLEHFVQPRQIGLDLPEVHCLAAGELMDDAQLADALVQPGAKLAGPRLHQLDGIVFDPARVQGTDIKMQQKKPLSLPQFFVF